MKQNWIHKPQTDGFFILLPPFLVLFIVVFFQDFLQKLEQDYSFYTWLFLIVFIDVAHVYATLFKTYFVPEVFNENKKRFIGIPVFCFFFGVFLFSFGSAVFWSVLAYIAVFHFIRQQYGFMRLYSRFENKTRISTTFDNLFIYTATVYPMLFWFLSPNRNFNWFVENEFFTFKNPQMLHFLNYLYASILVLYAVRTVYLGFKNRFFNIPKNTLIIGTGLSWYFGIVYYNNDLVFTLLNVVAHGLPYLALVFLSQIAAKPPKNNSFLDFFSHKKGILFYLLLLISIAFFEEYLWEILVWNDHFTAFYLPNSWQLLWVPLLTVPQFTHYLLDGFIWKKNKDKVGR
ncbi:MAG: hypothetical protein QG594_2282 [Bacteroidota bacterium]|nr:hypothetical protein [Bacteroidota bacterium]